MRFRGFSLCAFPPFGRAAPSLPSKARLHARRFL